MRKLLRLIAILAFLRTALPAADSAPALEWVKKLGGSGLSQVSGAAADTRGNFYIVGTTSSIDFPATTTAAQRNPGGSPLVRVNAATGGADKLCPPGLSALKFIAADPRNPARLYAAVANGISRSVDAG